MERITFEEARLFFCIGRCTINIDEMEICSQFITDQWIPYLPGSVLASQVNNTLCDWITGIYTSSADIVVDSDDLQIHDKLLTSHPLKFTLTADSDLCRGQHFKVFATALVMDMSIFQHGREVLICMAMSDSPEHGFAFAPNLLRHAQECMRAHEIPRELSFIPQVCTLNMLTLCRVISTLFFNVSLRTDSSRELYFRNTIEPTTSAEVIQKYERLIISKFKAASKPDVIAAIPRRTKKRLRAYIKSILVHSHLCACTCHGFFEPDLLSASNLGFLLPNRTVLDDPVESTSPPASVVMKQFVTDPFRNPLIASIASLVFDLKYDLIRLIKLILLETRIIIHSNPLMGETLATAVRKQMKDVQLLSSSTCGILKQGEATVIHSNAPTTNLSSSAKHNQDKQQQQNEGTHNNFNNNEKARPYHASDFNLQLLRTLLQDTAQSPQHATTSAPPSPNRSDSTHIPPLNTPLLPRVAACDWVLAIADLIPGGWRRAVSHNSAHVPLRSHPGAAESVRLADAWHGCADDSRNYCIEDDLNRMLTGECEISSDEREDNVIMQSANSVPNSLSSSYATTCLSETTNKGVKSPFHSPVLEADVNLVRHSEEDVFLLDMVTEDKPVLSSLALNTDVKETTEVALNNIINNDNSISQVEQIFQHAAPVDDMASQPPAEDSLLHELAQEVPSEADAEVMRSPIHLGTSAALVAARSSSSSLTDNYLKKKSFSSSKSSLLPCVAACQCTVTCPTLPASPCSPSLTPLKASQLSLDPLEKSDGRNLDEEDETLMMRAAGGANVRIFHEDNFCEPHVSLDQLLGLGALTATPFVTRCDFVDSSTVTANPRGFLVGVSDPAVRTHMPSLAPFVHAVLDVSLGQLSILPHPPALANSNHAAVRSQDPSKKTSELDLLSIRTMAASPVSNAVRSLPPRRLYSKLLSSPCAEARIGRLLLLTSTSGQFTVPLMPLRLPARLPTFAGGDETASLHDVSLWEDEDVIPLPVGPCPPWALEHHSSQTSSPQHRSTRTCEPSLSAPALANPEREPSPAAHSARLQPSPSRSAPLPNLPADVLELAISGRPSPPGLKDSVYPNFLFDASHQWLPSKLSKLYGMLKVNSSDGGGGGGGIKKDKIDLVNKVNSKSTSMIENSHADLSTSQILSNTPSFQYPITSTCEESEFSPGDVCQLQHGLLHLPTNISSTPLKIESIDDFLNVTNIKASFLSENLHETVIGDEDVEVGNNNNTLIPSLNVPKMVYHHSSSLVDEFPRVNKAMLLRTKSIGANLGERHNNVDEKSRINSSHVVQFGLYDEERSLDSRDINCEEKPLRRRSAFGRWIDARKERKRMNKNQKDELDLQSESNSQNLLTLSTIQPEYNSNLKLANVKYDTTPLSSSQLNSSSFNTIYEEQSTDDVPVPDGLSKRQKDKFLSKNFKKSTSNAIKSKVKSINQSMLLRKDDQSHNERCMQLLVSKSPRIELVMDRHHSLQRVLRVRRSSDSSNRLSHLPLNSQTPIQSKKRKEEWQRTLERRVALMEANVRTNEERFVLGRRHGLLFEANSHDSSGALAGSSRVSQGGRDAVHALESNGLWGDNLRQTVDLTSADKVFVDQLYENVKTTFDEIENLLKSRSSDNEKLNFKDDQTIDNEVMEKVSDLEKSLKLRLRHYVASLFGCSEPLIKELANKNRNPVSLVQSMPVKEFGVGFVLAWMTTRNFVHFHNNVAHKSNGNLNQTAVNAKKHF